MTSYKAHDDWIRFILKFENDKLISCSDDNKIKQWNLETFEFIKSIEDYLSEIYCLEITLNNNLLSCSNN